MMPLDRFAVIGDGGWGTTLAILLAHKGYDVSVWGAFPDYIDLMREKRENVKFLPGVKIPESVHLTADMTEALRRSQAVVLAAPSQHMRSVLDILKMHGVGHRMVVSVAKGIETGTLKRMSEVIREVLGELPLAVLSGPTIALEVAHGTPTTIVAASEDRPLLRPIQEAFTTDRFRVYTNDDIIGVEIGGSIKNIIAIAAGMSDAMGFGTNAKAALLTRGLVEIVRLGRAMGARRETFYGLAGLGDLTTTCISQYSRNRWLGEEIGKGKKLADVLRETEMVVEGVATAKSGYELSLRHGVEMPITAEVYRILYEHKDPRKAVHDLMTRSMKSEHGGVDPSVDLGGYAI